MHKQAMDLKVGDTVVGATGTAVVEAVTAHDGFTVVRYAEDRTMSYIDTEVTYTREMNPLMQVS